MNRSFVLLLLLLPSLAFADESWNASTRRLICTSVAVKSSSVSATAFTQLPPVAGRRVVLDQFDLGMAGGVTGSSEVAVVIGDSSGYIQDFTERYPYAAQNVAQSNGGYTSNQVHIPVGLTYTVGAGLVFWIKAGTFSNGTLRCAVCAHYE